MSALVMLGIGAAALGVLAIARSGEKKKTVVVKPQFPVNPGIPPGPVVSPTVSPLPGPNGGGTSGGLPGPSGKPDGSGLPGPSTGVPVVPTTFKKPLNVDGTYTVVPGDYGTVIAKKLNPSDTYGASWKQLRPLNPQVMNRNDPSSTGFPVQIGDVLTVPDAWKAFWLASGTLPSPSPSGGTSGGLPGPSGGSGGGLPSPSGGTSGGTSPLPIAVIDPVVDKPETSAGWFW